MEMEHQLAISTLKTYEAAYFAGITEGLQGDFSVHLKSVEYYVPAFSSMV